MRAILVLILIVFPLQLLGFTGTCTQGANGPFITGSILSFVPLILSVGLMGWKWFEVLARDGGEQKYMTGSVIAATGILLFLTRDAWLGVILYGTPCGSDYSVYAELSSRRWIGDTLVIISYLALPFLIFGLSCGLLVRFIAQSKEI